ncbi:hypothetical protein [uncultured Rubinisphaera sp.]|uniref:hypothetical protein n=1 Tax=uncultured Rubinisphaera sp. TaxID=1678686 RepID=UPI0030DB797C
MKRPFHEPGNSAEWNAETDFDFCADVGLEKDPSRGCQESYPDDGAMSPMDAAGTGTTPGGTAGIAWKLVKKEII